ncbi:hypothetical protein B0H16DRAFT_1632683 [Mycena metata]|uniref:Wax synthase domain-containing protein n=1 Tax=Mycena metata TaxID=1033252 RepID=A0AAD7GZL1_9AGAR|nr:hypothetical protein B0H16DRAFT_1632683 [Mycena metata]
MKATVWQEISVGATRAFRTIVPKPQHRIALTWSNAPIVLSSFLPFVFLAYLARRPNTYLIRLLLLPTVLVATLTAGFRYRFTIPELNVYNWGLALLCEVVIGKALEYAFTKEGMLKVGERQPGQMKGKEAVKGEAAATRLTNGDANGHAASPEPPEPPARLMAVIPTWLYDAFELIHSMRGPRWKFTQGTHIPAPTRPLARPAFLRATLRSFATNFLLLDLLESLVKLFPGVGTPSGGSIFYAGLPPVPRYAVSTLIHMLTGSALLAGFGMVYDLIILIAVLLFDSAPASWPPITDGPWHAESMHQLWAHSWHQLLRSTFLVFGGYPGRWIAGDLGMLLGTFVASGPVPRVLNLHHGARAGSYLLRSSFPRKGPILIGERLWRRVTGKRVGGRIGRMWVYFVMFIAAQPMIDSWHKRGLGGGMVIMPFISPVRISLGILQKYWGIGKP